MSSDPLTQVRDRIAELEADNAALREAVRVLARWCANSLDDMMPGFVCENSIASAAVREAKEQA